MVHIKISVALILLAATITPVLALPVPGSAASKAVKRISGQNASNRPAQGQPPSTTAAGQHPGASSTGPGQSQPHSTAAAAGQQPGSGPPAYPSGNISNLEGKQYGPPNKPLPPLPESNSVHTHEEKSSRPPSSQGGKSTHSQDGRDPPHPQDGRDSTHGTNGG